MRPLTHKKRSREISECLGDQATGYLNLAPPIPTRGDHREAEQHHCLLRISDQRRKQTDVANDHSNIQILERRPEQAIILYKDVIPVEIQSSTPQTAISIRSLAEHRLVIGDRTSAASRLLHDAGLHKAITTEAGHLESYLENVNIRRANQSDDVARRSAFERSELLPIVAATVRIRHPTSLRRPGGRSATPV